MSIYPDTFQLVMAPQDSLALPLAPVIPRWLYDPITTGGCPQCGTYLYNHRGRQIRTEQVTHGRNFEIAIEDRYVRCGRCNFPIKISRHTAHPRGARTGWGTTDTIQSSTWTA